MHAYKAALGGQLLVAPSVRPFLGVQTTPAPPSSPRRRRIARGQKRIVPPPSPTSRASLTDLSAFFLSRRRNQADGSVALLRCRRVYARRQAPSPTCRASPARSSARRKLQTSSVGVLAYLAPFLRTNSPKNFLSEFCYATDNSGKFCSSLGRCCAEYDQKRTRGRIP